MAMSWPVAVRVLGSLESGSLLWTYRGGLNVTIVLRTSYALAAGPAVLLPADAVDREDRHYGDAPGRAVRTASDVVPRVPRAEIVHAGAVFAPAGVTMVRLLLSREGRRVFEKRAVASAQSSSKSSSSRRRSSTETMVPDSASKIMRP